MLASFASSLLVLEVNDSILNYAIVKKNNFASVAGEVNSTSTVTVGVLYQKLFLSCYSYDVALLETRLPHILEI